ncbi:MAG: hypothetical protein M3467_00730 [Actinomycetota bacterium]|nr:hypothetical protein [Actinomycetota bacterium]
MTVQRARGHVQQPVVDRDDLGGGYGIFAIQPRRSGDGPGQQRGRGQGVEQVADHPSIRLERLQLLLSVEVDAVAELVIELLA